MQENKGLVTPVAVYPDVIGLLTADHRKVEALFEEFQAKKDRMRPHEKFELVRKVCAELLIHMAVEEGVFYPAVRSAIYDNEVMDEAQVEHDSAKELIILLGKIQPDDPLFDTKVIALAEQIEHHVQEEEAVMFSKVLVSDIDLVALGKELLDAKNNMRGRLGLPIEEVAEEHYSQGDFYFSSQAQLARSRLKHI